LSFIPATTRNLFLTQSLPFL
jgi:hypothetical protein